MTTAESLNALADRVEREEPSRGLDIDIACAALGWEKERQGGYIGQTPPDYAWNLRPIGRAYWDDGSRKAPPYTTSLDSAVTLVPEGWVWLRKSASAMTCAFVPTSDKDWGVHIDATGRTPAAALTAAALRARAALLTDGADSATGKGQDPQSSRGQKGFAQ